MDDVTGGFSRSSYHGGTRDQGGRNADPLMNYMNARDRIRRKKERGDPWPWSKDVIFQTYRFTNVRRCDDAVSVDCNRRVLISPWDDDATLLFEVVKYRLFNLPSTYRLLRPVRGRWDERRSKAILRSAQDEGKQIFTGAYIVSNMGETRPKIDIVCEALTVANRESPSLVKLIRAGRALQNATKVIERYVPCCGMFVAYEIVSDLRWTSLLKGASDIMTWANPGPGATRGLNRLFGRPLKAKPPVAQLVQEMRV